MNMLPFEKYENRIANAVHLGETYAKHLGCDSNSIAVQLSANSLATSFGQDAEGGILHTPVSIMNGDNEALYISKRYFETDGKKIPFAVVDDTRNFFLLSKKEDMEVIMNGLEAYANSLRKAKPAPPKVFIEKEILDRIEEACIDYLAFALKHNITASRGVILYGPPGNGKSMITRHLQYKASQAGLNYNLFCSANVHKVLEVGYSSVNVMDDVDVDAFSRRGGGSSFASSLLSVMDGVGNTPRTYVLTTNEDVGKIHAAFLRPGRFDLAINIKKPSKELRLDYINSWKMKIDTEKLADASNDWSFAELIYVRNLLLLEKFKGNKMNLDKTLQEYNTRLEWRNQYAGTDQIV